jgi:hypothetical protein
MRMKNIIAVYIFVLCVLLFGELYLRSSGQPTVAQEARQSMGSQDMPFAQQKPRGVTRVLIVGDSYTWGGSIKPEERFAEILGTYSPRLQVATLALPGGNTSLEFDYWKMYGRDVQADIVILAIGNDDNDLGFVEKPVPPQYLQSILPGSSLAQFLDSRINIMWYNADRRYLQRLYADSVTQKAWGTILAQFADDIRQHGAEPWALILTHPFFEDEALTRSTIENTESIAEAAGFRTLNFMAEYERYYGDLENNPERWAAKHDSHYNAETNTVVAEFLWNQLNNRKALANVRGLD